MAFDLSPSAMPLLAPDLLGAAPIGVIAIDGAGDVSAANPAACALLGWPATQLIGASAHDRLHAVAGGVQACPLEAPLHTHEPAAQSSDTFRRGDGSLLPVWWSAAPLPGPEGGAVIVFADDTDWRAQSVTDTAEHEQGLAELASARRSVSDLEWVGRVTEVLSSILDERQVLLRLARLAVARIADIAIVDQVTDKDTISRFGGAVADRIDIDLDAIIDGSGATHDLAIGSATHPSADGRRIIRLTPDEIGDPSSVGPRERALLLATGAASALFVPLAARGHIVGRLGLIRRAGRAQFDDVDVLIAADIGRRAALAVDNARMYRAQIDIAVQLQEALLPTSVDGPIVRAAVRYLPALDHFEVGGDWYDMFSSPSTADTSVLLIGDVAGHDLTAATTMAAVRNLLRGVAVATDGSPAEVITAVDDNLANLGITGTASTIVMTVQPAGRKDWALRWSNAGHLPPLLISPIGGVELLDEIHGPVLGTRTYRRRAESSRTVPAGSTIVLYTDGLVEVRHESLDVGLDRLLRTARSAAGSASDPERLADELIAGNRTSTEDDTALLVCHLPGRG